MIWSRTSSSSPLNTRASSAPPVSSAVPLSSTGRGLVPVNATRRSASASRSRRSATATPVTGYSIERRVRTLSVGGPQPGRVFDRPAGTASPGPPRQIVLAVALTLGDGPVLPRVADIETLERDRALARGPGEIDLGAERQQRRGEIAAEGGKAHAAAFGRHVADLARGLEAMV